MTTRGRGQPSKIDQIIRVRDDGTEITAGQQVIDRVQLGMDLAAAADSAGINRLTLHRWRVDGARFRAEEARGKLPNPTDHQIKYIDFCNAIDRAEAEAEAARLAIIQRAATGGGTVTRITTKRDGTGALLETVEVRETLKPDAQWAAWWLERRRRRTYSSRLEVTGAEGSPLVPPAEQARDLADSLREYLQGVEDGKTAVKANGKGKP